MRKPLIAALAALVALAGGWAGARSTTLPADLSLYGDDPRSAAHFGSTLASGDIDGDGAADLIVASTGFGAADGGEVAVFSGASGTLVRKLYSAQPENAPRFGRSLATGDVNGDGFDDVIVGSPYATAPGAVTTAGEVAVFYGPDLTSSRLLYDPAPQALAAFGISVAAGDINGDGYAEVVAGAWDSNIPPFNKAGEAFVFTAPALSTVTTLRSPDPQDVADFGVATAVADVDGDGLGDVIVGSWIADIGAGRDVGLVFVFRGPAIASPPLTISNAGAGIRLGRALSTGDVDGDGDAEIAAGTASGAVIFDVAPGAGSYTSIAVALPLFGDSVSLRDANGDGHADLLVGGPLADPGGVSDAGGAALLLGPAFDRTYAIEPPAPEQDGRLGAAVLVAPHPPSGRTAAYVGAPEYDAPGLTDAGVVFGELVDDPDTDRWLDDDNCPWDSNPSQANADAASRPNGPLIAGEDVTVHGDGLGDACDPDNDGDGMADTVEAVWPVAGCPAATAALDPADSDGDGDHLIDGWECANGSDPADGASRVLGSGSADLDGDRVPDVWEQRGYAMSPASADSDGDGCADLVEVASVNDDRVVTAADRLAVARRALGLWPPDMEQDYVLDLDKNGSVGTADRLFVARAALLPDWAPKSC